MLSSTASLMVRYNSCPWWRLLLGIFHDVTCSASSGGLSGTEDRLSCYHTANHGLICPRQTLPATSVHLSTAKTSKEGLNPVLMVLSKLLTGHLLPEVEPSLGYLRNRCIEMHTLV